MAHSDSASDNRQDHALQDYIPNRDPFWDIQRKASGKQAVSTSRRSCGWMLLLLATAALAHGYVGWRAHQWHERNQAELAAKTVELLRLRQTIQQTEKTTSTSFAKARQQLTVLVEERDRLQADFEGSRREQQRLAQRAVDFLTQTGTAVQADPALSGEIWKEGIGIASSQGLDGQALTELLQRLPLPKVVTRDCSLVIERVIHDRNFLTVEVTVRDASGEFVKGLSRTDFDLYSETRRLHAVAVAQGQQNAFQQDVALVLDRSASTRGPANAALREGALQLVQAVADPSQLRVWSFADDVTPMTPWTHDASLHELAIRGMAAEGGTALYEAIRLAVEDLRQRKGPRSLVLFTDGSDSSQRESVGPTLLKCRQESIAIHVIALQTGETKESLLRQIALETQGSYHAVTDPSRLIEQFQRLAESFRRSVYRLHVYEPVDAESLTLKVGPLPAISIERMIAAGNDQALSP